MTGRRITVVSDNELDGIEDRTAPDAPVGPALGPAFWARAAAVEPRRKSAISLRIDDDVLAWFKRQGPGYQTRINAVLRSFMEARRHGRNQRDGR